jgi:flagellar basal-body rod protein FlgB
VDRSLLTMTRGLDHRARRHAAIAANIANADTPGYRTVDVPFRTELERAGLTLSTTHPTHLKGSRFPPRHDLVLVGGTPRRDGNDVDVDRQMVELARNQIEYRFLTRALGGRFRKLKDAITGRNSS